MCGVYIAFEVFCTHARQRRIRNLRPYCHDEEQPCLRVQRRLFHLIPFEMPVLDALPVGRHAFDGDRPLALGQKPGCRGQVRQDEQRPDARRDGDGSEDDKDVHPSGQAGGDVSHCVADQAVHG